jgi:murein DD-endopeptidase MepM/ murein hydrolase activator NlpD
MHAAARTAVSLAIVAMLVLLALSTPYPALVWRIVAAAAPEEYVVPVEGVRAADLRRSFGAPRSGGRTHEGIDILARRGTPVVAAADGLVVSTRPNRLGGTVVWVAGAGRRLYYYAHLDAVAPRVRVGAIVRAGDRVGVVGTSGNAAGGAPHLHFGIYRTPSPFADGASAAVDPYPLLREAFENVDDARPAARPKGRAPRQRLSTQHPPSRTAPQL